MIVAMNEAVRDMSEYAAWSCKQRAKLHKVGVDVPLHVCSAEQKIAYNIASNLVIDHAEMFNRLISSREYHSAIDGMLSGIVGTAMIEWNTRHHARNYNPEMIELAISNGVRNYFLVPFTAKSYAEISRTFPLFDESCPAECGAMPSQKYKNLDNMALRSANYAHNHKSRTRYYLYYESAESKPKILRVDSTADHERLNIIRTMCKETRSGSHVEAVSREIAELLIEVSLRPRAGLPLIDIDEMVKLPTISVAV